MPTLTGFIAWIRAVMGVGTNYLPDASPVIATAYSVALSIVNDQFACIDPSIYSLMVYNLGGDNIINYAPDQSAAITGITWTLGVATVTTAANTFANGDQLSIIGVNPLGYNVAYPNVPPTVAATVVSSTSFKFPLVTNPGAYVAGGLASETYFQGIRQALKIGSFKAGVISAASDESTSETLLTPSFMEGLTLANLQNLKTPYGKTYLQFAQSYGTLWGLT